MTDKVTDEELIEAIKRPIRFYNIRLWGYGGESAYIKINKAQYDFWKSHRDEHGDYDLVNYMINAEDGEYDFENLKYDNIPKDAHFMFNEDGDPSTWYEHHEELEHQWGIDYSNANIDIDEVETEEYNSKVLDTVVSSEDLSEWVNKIHEENPDSEITEMGISEFEDWDAEYVLQFYSAEKGTMFDGQLTTKGKLDPTKLMINTSEYANGDDTIASITYDGEEIDNNGGDTNGKGYSVHLWEN